MATVRRAAAAVARSPLEGVLWLGGDFNADAPGESVQAAPQLQRRTQGRVQLRRACVSFEGVMQALTEIEQPMCTRMAETASAAMSRIDSVYTSAPGWLLQAMQVFAYVGSPPEVTLNKGLSDQVVVTVVVQRRRTQPLKLRRRPQHIHSTACFAEVLGDLEAATSWEDMSPFAALAHHKAHKALMAAAEQCFLLTCSRT